MSPRDAWNPEQYEVFKALRDKPFFDLIQPIRRRPGMRVLDLGCGPGSLTRALHESLTDADTLGLDASPAMLERTHAEITHGLRFELADVRDFDGDGVYDLIVSNAMLQWVEEPEARLRTIIRGLAPGGQLAVQVPANHTHASHTVANAVAAEEPFATALNGYQRPAHVLTAEGYAHLLHDAGLVDLDVRLQIYPQTLDRRSDIVSWVRGTLLTAYQTRLSPNTFDAFLVRYEERLLAHLEAQLGPERDGVGCFYPYARILFHGTRP